MTSGETSRSSVNGACRAMALSALDRTVRPASALSRSRISR